MDPEALGFLDPQVQTLTVDDPESFGITLFDEDRSRTEGLVVLTITPDSEAAKAGIIEYTNILRVGGEDVYTQEEFLNALKPGVQVEFVLDPLTELISDMPAPIGVGDPARRMEVQQAVQFVRMYHDHDTKEARVTFNKTLIALIALMSNVRVKHNQFEETVAKGRALIILRRAVRNWKERKGKQSTRAAPERQGFTHKGKQILFAGHK